MASCSSERVWIGGGGGGALTPPLACSCSAINSASSCVLVTSTSMSLAEAIGEDEMGTDSAGADVPGRRRSLTWGRVLLLSSIIWGPSGWGREDGVCSAIVCVSWVELEWRDWP